MNGRQLVYWPQPTAVNKWTPEDINNVLTTSTFGDDSDFFNTREQGVEGRTTKVSINDICEFVNLARNNDNNELINFVAKLLQSKSPNYVLDLLSKVYVEYPGDQELLVSVADVLASIDYLELGDRKSVV